MAGDDDTPPNVTDIRHARAMRHAAAAKRISELEAENTRLRAEVAKLRGKLRPPPEAPA